MAKKVKIKNNSDVTIHGLKPGEELLIEVDENGTPIDRNWRRRFIDSKIDGAISIVKPEKKKKEA